jgi:hypothetical protein
VTARHKHREVKVKPGGLVIRLLRKPLLTTTRLDWVERSRMVFGVVPHADHEHEHYTLSLLGICHGLFGLTLYTYE